MSSNETLYRRYSMESNLKSFLKLILGIVILITCVAYYGVWNLPIVIETEYVVNYMRNLNNVIVWLIGFYGTILTISISNELISIDGDDGKNLLPSMIFLLLSIGFIWTSNMSYLMGDIIPGIRALLASLFFSFYGLIYLVFFIMYRQTFKELAFAFYA